MKIYNNKDANGNNNMLMIVMIPLIHFDYKRGLVLQHMIGYLLYQGWHPIDDCNCNSNSNYITIIVIPANKAISS